MKENPKWDKRVLLVRATLLFLVPGVLQLPHVANTSSFARATAWISSLLGLAILVLGGHSQPRSFARLPFVLRLALFWTMQLQLCVAADWLFFEASGNAFAAGDSGALATLSVVLPCANEGEYALKTAQSVFEATPAGILSEILIVDDGSSPPVRELFSAEQLEKFRVKILRHESHTGLINAKRVGGNAATGDVVVFLDCHVKPRPNWQRGILGRMSGNYKRVVVPSITALNPDTWEEESGGGGGLAKTYLTWDADFKWFDSDENFVPVMSGGLLAISRRWWQETGGYDSAMSGWGGENLDQSLRIWLCGGEIVQATDSFVAHMWRTGDRPSTRAKYTVPPGSTMLNRYRAGAAWMGPFAEKLRTDFPAFKSVAAGNPDLSEIQAVNNRLQCKPFVWFLNRFKYLYVDAGLLPDRVFHIKDLTTGLCLQRHLHNDQLVLSVCSAQSPGQLWHGANRQPGSRGSCCGGLRNWNSDQCIQTRGSVGTAVQTYVCNTYGRVSDQVVSLTGQGKLLNGHGLCVGVAKDPGPRLLLLADCSLAPKFEQLRSGRLTLAGGDGRCVAMAGGDHFEVQACDELDDAQVFRLGSGQVRNGPFCFDGNAGKLTAYPCHRSAEVGHTQKFEISKDGYLRQTKGGHCVAFTDGGGAGAGGVQTKKTAVKLETCVVNNDQSVRESQTWHQIGNGQTFRVRSGHAGNLCLSVTAFRKVVVAACTGDVDTPASSPQQASDSWQLQGVGQLKHLESGLCLDGGASSQGGEPILYTCYGEDVENFNQQWTFDLKTIRNVQQDRCLDFLPLTPKSLVTLSCGAATQNFRAVDEFLPLETRLYRASYPECPLLRPPCTKLVLNCGQSVLWKNSNHGHRSCDPRAAETRHAGRARTGRNSRSPEERDILNSRKTRSGHGGRPQSGAPRARAADDRAALRTPRQTGTLVLCTSSSSC